jgi:hypothetical protein
MMDLSTVLDHVGYFPRLDMGTSIFGFSEDRSIFKDWQLIGHIRNGK